MNTPLVPGGTQADYRQSCANAFSNNVQIQFQRKFTFYVCRLILPPLLRSTTLRLVLILIKSTVLKGLPKPSLHTIEITIKVLHTNMRMSCKQMRAWCEFNTHVIEIHATVMSIAEPTNTSGNAHTCEHTTGMQQQCKAIAHIMHKICASRCHMLDLMYVTFVGDARILSCIPSQLFVITPYEINALLHIAQQPVRSN